MKKILLLTDLSDASHHALAFARSFFGDTVADFHLLCMYSEESGPGHGLLHTAETARTACADQLTDMLKTIRSEVRTDWHTFRSSACPGQPMAVVQTMVQAEPYDFVVIGPQPEGQNGLFGNGAIALVTNIPANVLVVPVHAPMRPARHIVLATDFGRLKNAKLLAPVKELATGKGAILTLLTIDTPGKTTVSVAQEQHLRQFLTPVEPMVIHQKAATAKQGIDNFLAGHEVDLLVTIPRPGHPTGTQTTRQPFAPAVPLLTLYDDGTDDQPQPTDTLTTNTLTTAEHVR
jgi:hypothetical protein